MRSAEANLQCIKGGYDDPIAAANLKTGTDLASIGLSSTDTVFHFNTEFDDDHWESDMNDTDINNSAERDTAMQHSFEEKQNAPGIGHNSTSPNAQPQAAAKDVEPENKNNVWDLEILREILAGPLAEQTSAQFENIIGQLEAREEELVKREHEMQQHINAVEANLAKREQELQMHIDAVKADLANREQALSQQIVKVEKDLADRENSIMQKVAIVEANLAKREQELANRMAGLSNEIESCRVNSHQISTELSQKMSLARQHHDRTIQDVGNAISKLGDHVAQMCRTTAH